MQSGPAIYLPPGRYDLETLQYKGFYAMECFNIFFIVLSYACTSTNHIQRSTDEWP